MDAESPLFMSDKIMKSQSQGHKKLMLQQICEHMEKD